MNFNLAPDKASNFAGPHDLLFYTITGLAVFFAGMVILIITICVVKYGRGKKADRSNPVNDHLKLELGWTGVPTILAITMFLWSTKVFIDMRTPPKGAYEVFVIGKQWMWHIQHPNGIRENNELHVPLGKPIKLTMISQDVIHGFYLPEMRVQYMVVPGRYTQQWFTPTKVGKFHIFCTIHCGTQHSEMGGYINVLTPDEFNRWKENGGNRFKPVPETLAKQGERIFTELACNTCHGVKDTDHGPSLFGIVGAQRALATGGTVTADEDYIRRSIIAPYDAILKNYKNTMPIYVYKDQVTEEQIRALLEYIKTLGNAAVVTPAAPQNPLSNTVNQTTSRRSSS